MGYRFDTAAQRRLETYFGDIGTVLANKRRREAFAAYALGLLSDLDRKSAEPIAAIAPRCYMRVDHPLANKEMDLQDFLAYRHLRLYLPGLTRENTSLVDDVLGQYGVHRTIALETTQFSSAVGVLTRTDSLLVANAGFQEGGLYRDRIVGHEMPAELQRMIRNTHSRNLGKMSLMRHTRSSRSAPHQWMRALLMKHLTRSDSKAESGVPMQEAS